LSALVIYCRGGVSPPDVSVDEMSIEDVDNYLNNLSEIAKEAVVSFVDFMKAGFPQINPKICFAMPMWWAGQKMYDGYVAISAAKNHFSIHFHDEQYIEKLKTILPGCSFGKRCINIKYGDEPAFIKTKLTVNNYFSGITEQNCS